MHLLRKKRLGTFVFKGFMADGAQTNKNDIHNFYGTKDPMMKMVDKE
jgi:hypothetical protein